MAKSSNGFTLIELMLTVAIVGILAGISVGYGGTQYKKVQYNQLVQEVKNIVLRTQSEAMRRGQRVTFATTSKGTSRQLVVYIDSNFNTMYDSADTLLYVYPTDGNSDWGPSFNIAGPFVNNPPGGLSYYPNVYFNASGLAESRMASTSGHYSFQSPQEKYICISCASLGISTQLTITRLGTILSTSYANASCS